MMFAVVVGCFRCDRAAKSLPMMLAVISCLRIFYTLNLVEAYKTRAGIVQFDGSETTLGRVRRGQKVSFVSCL